MQLYAPNDGRRCARNMLSHTRTSSKKLVKLLHLVGWFIWIGYSICFLWDVHRNCNIFYRWISVLEILYIHLSGGETQIQIVLAHKSEVRLNLTRVNFMFCWPVDFMFCASLYNLVTETNLVHNLSLVYFVSFIYNLYMFPTSSCPSSGGTAVFMRHLVFRYSVWLAVWCAGSFWWWTWRVPKHIEVTNKINEIYREYCAPSWFHLQDNTCNLDDLLLWWVTLQPYITVDVTVLAEFEMTNQKELVWKQS